MTTTTVNGNTLLFLDVPEKSYELEVSIDNVLHCWSGNEMEGHNQEYFQIFDKKHKYTIVGTISKEGEFSFDPEPYVMKSTPEEHGGFYDYESWEYEQPSATGSFITLLRSEGIDFKTLKQGNKYLVIKQDKV